jgi:hypothetical protein
MPSFDWGNGAAAFFGAIGGAFSAYLLGFFSHRKQQRLDLLRRLLGYRYEISRGVASDKTNILFALNEVKFHYHRDKCILDLWNQFYQAQSTSQADRDDVLVELIVAIAQKERRRLTALDVKRSFSTPPSQ